MEKKYSLEEVTNLKFEIQNLTFDIPKDIILNSLSHFQRFHGKKKNPFLDFRAKTLELDNNYFTNFSDQNLFEFYSGILTFDSTFQDHAPKNLL